MSWYIYFRLVPLLLKLMRGIIAGFAIVGLVIVIVNSLVPEHIGTPTARAQQTDSCRRFYDKAVEFASTAFVPQAFTKHNPHDTQLSMMYSQLYRACVIARTAEVNSR